jgi:hypothetical protein
MPEGSITAADNLGAGCLRKGIRGRRGTAVAEAGDALVAGVDLRTRECGGRVVVALQLASTLQSGVRLGCAAGISDAGFRVGLACGDQQPGRHRPRSARMMSLAATTPRRPVADLLGTGQ